MKWPVGAPPFQWQGEINRESWQLGGLVGWYNALAKHARDLSGNNNHGVLSGNCAATGINALTGQHYTFDGSGDYINVPDSANIDSQTLTLSMWVRIDNVSTSRCFIRKGPAPSGTSITWLWYWAVGGNAISFFGASKEKSYVANLAASTWYHIAVAVNSTDVKHYKNGIYQPESGVQPTWSNDANPLIIGDWSTFDMNGAMADIRVYNRFLSAAEIWQLYDPATRWELYAMPQPKYWFVPTVAGGIIPLIMHHRKQQAMS